MDAKEKISRREWSTFSNVADENVKLSATISNFLPKLYEANQ